MCFKEEGKKKSINKPAVISVAWKELLLDPVV